ncbi:hypothetical protein ABW286_13145 [Erwinia papayae]|uniref:Uncharacterized protein n=1 Tax=Erwinia papayae TaxID=206499 RepID=A0ABV3N2Z2_9GAMM
MYTIKIKKLILKDVPVRFDSEDPSHVTALVNKTIKDIELRIGYQLQNYISHYCQILTYIFNGNPGANWSQFIEFGSNDPIVWHLQMMGFSRDSAVFLKRNFSKHFRMDAVTNKLVISNKNEIKSYFSNDELYSLEIQSLL